METEKETTAPNPSVAPDGDQPQARLHLRFAPMHLELGAGQSGHGALSGAAGPAVGTGGAARYRGKPNMEWSSYGAGLVSARGGQQSELHTKLDRADAECAAGNIAAAVWRPLLVPVQERWQIHLSAKGRCTVMYGMYGKNGGGAAPQNTVHYRTSRTPAG